MLLQVPGKHLQWSHMAVPAADLPLGWWPLGIFQGGPLSFPFAWCFSGKLVSPKWKNFKGLRLLCWDKIRLNNVIWRAWYIQCEYGPDPTLSARCQAVPVGWGWHRNNHVQVQR